MEKLEDNEIKAGNRKKRNGRTSNESETNGAGFQEVYFFPAVVPGRPPLTAGRPLFIPWY